MILRSYLHTDPAVAISYLFGCGGQSAGAVVDPVEPPAFYLAEAARLGLAIRYVIDTRLHADHRSTGRELAAASGAAYVLHESALAASAARLRTLPDHVQVLPGAFSRSVCGRGLSGTPLSTIGFERRFNRAFSIDDTDALVALMGRDIPPPPGAAEFRAENMGLTHSRTPAATP